MIAPTRVSFALEHLIRHPSGATFSHWRRLILVPLGRANEVRPYYSSCGAGFHREAISSTVGGYHPSARGNLADRISLRGRPRPRPGEASKKSTSERGTNQSLYCTNGERKLPYAAQKKAARCSHFLPRVAIPLFGEFLGGVGDFFQKVPHKNPRLSAALCADSHSLPTKPTNSVNVLWPKQDRFFAFFCHFVHFSFKITLTFPKYGSIMKIG